MHPRLASVLVAPLESLAYPTATENRGHALRHCRAMMPAVDRQFVETLK
jgi:hypothetical protein